MSENKKPNRLINEKSPYLLQHAYNPVDWYPWGEEAFNVAAAKGLPILLSIGYSTCHWCHVMERESFEDEEVAEILNRNFISIKVDREERPDIDHIYMDVCQALTGHGGWPLTIFMSPDRVPFFAGTYYPKESHVGMTGLMVILERVIDAWENKRDALLESGSRIKDMLTAYTHTQEGEINIDVIHEAYSLLKDSFDNVYGGFGKAPKFPTPHNLYFLLRYWYSTGEEAALRMVEKTLDSMICGGIYDHIGFGFCRYSTDRKWLVPHFEKMLYDNALLAIAYLEAYQATGKKRYADTAEKIFTYVLRDMTSDEGGFYSAEDADSEGVEGKFYTWTPGEVKSVLGDADAEEFNRRYDISMSGNFEGVNIPNLIKGDIQESNSDFIDRCRHKLFEYREKRVHPYKDDKILTSWNGLMIAALAIGGRVLRNEKYTKAAINALMFINNKLVRKDGRLLARYRDGEAAYPAYADDYTFLTWALIETYETTFEPVYLEQALKLCKDMADIFMDTRDGGYYLYGKDSEQLIARPKEIYDGAIPSANSVAALNMLRLSRLTGDFELENNVANIFKAFGHKVSEYPAGYTYTVMTALYMLAGGTEVIINSSGINKESDKFRAIPGRIYSPFTVFLLNSPDKKDIQKLAPFLESYKALDGKDAAYICEKGTCRTPVTTAAEVESALLTKTALIWTK